MDFLRAPTRRPEPARLGEHVAEPEPAPQCDIDEAVYGPKTNFVQVETQRVFTRCRHPKSHMLDDTSHLCTLFNWKSQSNMQRQGRALGPRCLNGEERTAFGEASTKEWMLFLEAGAVEVVTQHDTSGRPTRHAVFSRPKHTVLTHNNKDENGALAANTLFVTPGDVDPGFETPIAY